MSAFLKIGHLMILLIQIFSIPIIKCSSFFLYIYNQMRKKDHQPQALNLTSNKQIIIASAFKHYERGKIDSVVLSHFNSLIYSITLKLVKYNNQPEIQELFRITNELIVGFIANLSEETYRHSCTHQDVLQLLLTLANYFEKSVTVFGFGQLILQSNLLNIFWPLFEKQLDGPKSQEQSKIDLVNAIIQNIQQPKKNTSSFGNNLKQSFFVANSSIKKDKFQVKEHFVAFLRQTYPSSSFRQVLLKYLLVALSENNEILFKKGLKIYEHIGSNIEERRSLLEDLLLKTLDFNNCLPFVIEINECVKLPKLVSSTNFPKVIERILQKIFAKHNSNAICVKILEELTQANNCELRDFNTEKIVASNQNLVVKFLQWVQLKYSKKEQNQNSISSQVLQLREKMLQEPDFKQEKLIQFVKKMSQKNGNEVPDLERMNQLKKVCSYFSNFIKNLYRHQSFRRKISIKNIDGIGTLKFCDKFPNPYIIDFVLDIFPHLIEDLTFNPKDKSQLKYSIILRKAEIEAQKSLHSLKTLKDSFKEVFYQMLQAESLNYHFVVCFIFLKYEKEKDIIRQIIVDAIINDLKKQGSNKNARNLLLSISLFLKSFDNSFISQPIKFKIRQVIKNGELLASKIDINNLILVQPKQYTNLKHENLKFQNKVEQMKQILNRQIFNYDAKQHLNIFFNLIIAINDLIGNSSNKDENILLTQIASLRRLSLVGQLYVSMHLINEAIDKLGGDYKFSSPLKIQIFLLLLKIKKIAENTSIRQSDEMDQLFQKLKYFMILINSELSHDLLTHLQSFRSNQKIYFNQPYEKLLQEKQIIKFFAEVTKDANLNHVVLNVTAKNVLSKVMEIKKVDFIDLPDELKNIILLYSKAQQLKLYGYNSEQEQLLTTYLMTLLLNQKIKQKLPLQGLLKKLSLYAPAILQLFLPQHHKDSFKNLMVTYPINFFNICVDSVKRVLSSNQKDDCALFEFVKTVIQEDNKNCGCLEGIIREVVEKQLQINVCQLIFKRTKQGFQLQQKSLYFRHSEILYKLVGKNLDKSKENLLELVQNIVELDCYNQSDKSAFLLKEISYIFTYLQEKSSQICQTIFNYILTLTDIFKGDQKLQISTFICNFFGLQISLNQSINFENFEKQTVPSCSNIPNYKCLKCDQKKIVCFGCAFTCHQGHPVCYLNIPIQLKFTRCLCCEIGGNSCKLAKENPNKANIFGKPPSFMGMNGLKPIVGPGSNPPQQFFERMKIVGGNFMPSNSRHPRENLFQPPLPSDRIQFQAFLRQEELEQQIRASHAYDPFRDRQRREQRQENFPRMGGRLQKLFERDEFPGGYRMFIQSGDIKRPSKIGSIQQKEKEKEKPENANQSGDQEFTDENYASKIQKNKEEMSIQHEDSNTILKKSVLLPKFIDLMVNFCKKKSEKDKSSASVEMFKLSFTNPHISKIQPANVFKLHNNGNFAFDIRKENAIHNMSCFLVKKNVAQNSKFLLLSSSTQIFVFSKDRIMQCLLEMKTLPGYNSIARHSISFQVHSLDFSPSQKNLFCAAGLHNLALLSINNQGQISRTNNRYNVSNCYINQIKLAKMGVFIGVDKEIRVLNYTCRHFLTIKAQQSNVIIRQWTIFEKAAGCQVLFVCPNGNIFTVDIMPSDEGRKEFSARINDHRPNKAGVGASIFGKQLPEIGKYLFASFKDGIHNILGHLQGDQLEDMIMLQLKGLKFDKNIFDNYFIVGHSDLVKIPQIDEFYLICTVKKYFPPELSFHQGFLIAIRFKQGGNSEIILINDQVTCQYFQVIKLGKRNFFIYSIHTDGSVQITTFNKITKQIIEEQMISIKESEEISNQNQNENKQNAQDINSLRKSIQRQVKLQSIVNKQEKLLYLPFREGAELLKCGVDYSLQKQNEIQYDFKLINFNKIVTGFSLPFFGQVELPNRKIKNTFEVGFTQLQILYFFSQGSIRFKYKKNEEQKYTREAFFNANNHPRMLQRIERMERLSEYHQGQKMFNSHLMNTILGFKEDTSSQLQFVGKSFDVFKAKIPKFQEIFRLESDNQTSSIEKTALIIKMFLTKGLQLGNICSEEEILDLVKGVKSIIALSSKRLFNILKDIIVLAIKVYQNLTGKNLTINDQNYALRAATQNRVAYYFKMLKLDISQADLNQYLVLLCEIIKQDKVLMAYYVAKYSGIFVHIHRRLKKPDTQQRANFLIHLYTFAYPILKFCEIPCSWILGSICSIVYSFLGSKQVRESLYQAVQNTKFIVFDNSLKNVSSLQEIVEQIDLGNSVPEVKKQEAKDPMIEIYNMYNRGQIDDQTLFKMITDASKLQYERQQQNQMAVQEKNLEIQPQLEQEMEIEENVVNHNIAFVLDQLDECTDNLSQNIDAAYAKIIVLYVVSKAIDSFFPDGTKHILKRMKKMVSQIDLKCEGDKLNSTLAFACLFNNILVNSNYLKENGGKSNSLYIQLETQVNNKLGSMRLQNIPKIKQPPNLLGKAFRGQKSNFNIHIAYALTCLLIFPCEPTHVLLSLQCYWLLPEKREFYSKKKDFSNITDGIQSGNIQKIYEIAKNNPKIWQEYNQLIFVEKWIEEKRPNWELALELMAIFYQD